MAERTWFKSFTPEELEQWRDKTKVCARCLETKDIIQGFGIKRQRYYYDPPESTRRRVCVKAYCFKCSSALSAARFKRNRPEKYAESLVKLRELDKRPEIRAKKAEYRKEWGKRTGKNSEYHKSYIKRHPLRHLARLMAKFAYPIPQNCSIAGCNKEGIRHHADYAKPLEIVWLCRTHHNDEHRRLKDEQLLASNTHVE